MKSHRQLHKSNSKLRLLLVLTIVALVIGVLTFCFVSSHTNTKTSQTPTDESSLQNDTQDTNNTEEVVEVPQNESPLKTDPQQSTETSPEKTTTVTVSASNQTESTYQIRALINVVTNDGICTLTMTKGSSTINRTANVQAGPSYTSCKGFDIPISELSPGTWSITLQYTNNSTTATISNTVDIK